MDNWDNLSEWEEFMSEYDIDVDNLYGDNDND